MTAEQRRLVEQLRGAGRTHRQISEATGLPRSSVHYVLTVAKDAKFGKVTPVDERPLSAKYRDFEEQMRACPIEIGMCVDQECEHGNIPSRRHPNPPCDCWANRSGGPNR